MYLYFVSKFEQFIHFPRKCISNYLLYYIDHNICNYVLMFILSDILSCFFIPNYFLNVIPMFIISSEESLNYTFNAVMDLKRDTYKKMSYLLCLKYNIYV